jgi:DivIVA domain-containing protein
MIDLTPLDVRKKKGDFRKGLRGYEIAEVDSFLDLVAERMEELVRENALLKERSSQLADGLNAFRSREQAMNEALVSAQQLREEIRAQTQREAE